MLCCWNNGNILFWQRGGSKVAVAQKRVYPRCACKYSHVASHLGGERRAFEICWIFVEPQEIHRKHLPHNIKASNSIPMQTSMEVDCEWSWWKMMTMLPESLLSGPIFVTVSTFCLLDRLDFAFCAASEQWDAEFSPSYPHFFGYHTWEKGEGQEVTLNASNTDALRYASLDNIFTS